MSLFEQKSLLAKLMASEDMRIQQAKVSTASFDVLNRVLTVPILDKDMGKDVYDLFMGHECGHALWTPVEGMRKAKADGVNMSVLNVVEDSRIERRIKNKYPGIKTPFINAYSTLFADNFFETEGENLSEFNFIDRVNLHCKVGAGLALPFTEDERKLLNEIEKTETFDDVIEVTKKICDFMKEQLTTERQKQKVKKVAVLVDATGDEKGETLTEEELEQYDEVIDARENAPEQGNPEQNLDESEEKLEDQIRSFTDDAYKRNEGNLFSKDNSKYVYVNIPEYDTSKIMDYKDVIRHLKKENYTVDVSKFNRYRREASKVVSYLVKEFELRKNANQMKRAATAKTGDLNMNRLYSYQFTDDIFKKVTVMPQGKSHGLVMFLDWSGSMVNHIENTIKQLLNLAMFCQKVNIPFEVYSFLDNPLQEYMNYQKKKAGDLMMGRFGLVNLLSSRMNSSDFTLCSAALMKMSTSNGNGYRNYPPNFLPMSGTPLNEAIIAAMEIVPQFQKRNRLQIVNTVILTDGEGSYCTSSFDKWGYPAALSYTHMVIRDPKTRNEEVFDRHSSTTTQADAFIKLLKQRTNSHVIGFFVGSTRDITNRVQYFFPEYLKLADFGDRENFRDKIKEEFRKNSSLVATATGFDDYYLLRSNGLDTEVDTELDFSEKATTRGMASAFSKYAGGKISSRVVLNRFIELIS